MNENSGCQSRPLHSIFEMLRLREANEADRAFVAALLFDADVMRFLSISGENAERLIAEMFDSRTSAKHGKVYRLVERADDGVRVGYASVENFGQPRVRINFAIAPELRKRGYGKILVNSLVDWLSKSPGIRTVAAVVLSRNVPSQRLMEKCGFTRKPGSVFEKAL